MRILYWAHKRRQRKNRETKDYLNYFFLLIYIEDIVFGGEKKLRKAISEAVKIFNPKTIMICSTCPVGLIGDDINAVANWATKEFGVKTLAFSCEGYNGVSQSGGHHIANNGLIKHIIGTGDKAVGKYSLNILGEYNIGGDGWDLKTPKKIGYD